MVFLAGVLVLLDNLQIQGSLVNCREGRILILRELLADGVMKSDNEKLYLEVLHECLFHVSPIPFAEIISPDCLWQNVQLAGYEPLEGFHIGHEENVNAFSRSLH